VRVCLDETDGLDAVYLSASTLEEAK
jgi:hypothetical protein